MSQGQKIASLDTYKLQSELQAGKTALAKAELELEDALIGQGYDPEKKASIPSQILKLAKLRSGYSEAELNIAKASHEIEQATLYAPFSGTIANISQKKFNRPDASKPFCRVIGNTMDVDFTILESELSIVKVGDNVAISTFANADTYSGIVTEINPIVEENGLVTVTASVASAKGLYDGMNVKVSVRRSLGKQLVVPKSAVVLRSGKQVVFTLSEDGKQAIWNYVQTGLENMNQYTIVEGLHPGMKIIVAGNVDLAHEAPVKVIK